MNHNIRNWNVLNWNTRGLNDEGKACAERQKIEESCCSVFCIQEIKWRTSLLILSNDLPPSGSPNLPLAPLEVPRGGGGRCILMGWNDSLLQGSIEEVNLFSITAEFASRLSADH
jgi:hypothetical protein